MTEQKQSASDEVRGGSPDQPSHSADGVDLTLIRWMLSLTPEQRLDVLQQHLKAIVSLRDANPDL